MGWPCVEEEITENNRTVTAYANFEETIKSSIKVGKLADMVVLSRNIVTGTNLADILKTQVLYTIVGGKIVYKK